MAKDSPHHSCHMKKEVTFPSDSQGQDKKNSIFENPAGVNIPFVFLPYIVSSPTCPPFHPQSLFWTPIDTLLLQLGRKSKNGARGLGTA